MTIASSTRTSVPAVAVLVVDDSAASREMVGCVLRCLNIHISEADTGAAAIRALRSRRFDLALIDFRLPDISGLEVVIELKKDRISVPWLLMSGLMTPPLAVAAMRLGAIDAVELPFDIEKVVGSALRELSAGWPRIPAPSLLSRPRSAAERWAFLVLRSCAAEHDLKTIRDWASVAGVSYSALTESCRLVGIRPHDARDFLRMLRALSHANGRLESLEHGLDVNDHRTLKTLFARAGVPLGYATGTISLCEFIDRQQFVNPACEGIRLLLKTIGAGERPRIDRQDSSSRMPPPV